MALLDDFSWAVGVLEGEASFNIHKRTIGEYVYWYPRIECNMADEDVIRRLQATLGGKVQGPYQNKQNLSWTPMWRWSCKAMAEAAAIMTTVRPFMSGRRQEQIDLALSFTPGRQN